MDMRAAEESGRNMSLKWRENKRESPHGQVLLIMVTVLCFVAAGCPPRKPVPLATRPLPVDPDVVGKDHCPDRLGEVMLRRQSAMA